MKLDSDDPKLTAYALGELPEDEAATIENAIAQSPEAEAWVADVTALAATVRTAFAADLFERKRLSIIPLPAARSWRVDDCWCSSAVAALVTIGAFIAAVAFSGTPAGTSLFARTRPAKAPAELQIELVDAEIDAAGTLTGQGDRFVSATDNPIATFPIQVGKASYLDVQRTIASGSLPARAAVRIEELINHFAYDDPAPEADRPFSISAEVAGCPWRKEHRLVRIALKAQGAAEVSGPSAILAQDVMAQVEFNPRQVASYRLVGFDQALSAGAAGEIHAGDALTLLYEVVPAETMPEIAEAALVKVHYRQPARKDLEVLEESVRDEGHDFLSASPDFKFAAAVAEFGMFLRNWSVENGETLGAIAELAKNALDADPDGRRAAFIELIRQTQLLTRG